MFSAKGQTENLEFFVGVAYQPSFAFKKSTKGNAEFILKSQYNLKGDNAITVSICITSPMTLSKTEEPVFIYSWKAIPMMLGYKKLINKFYVEPQIGAGIFSKRYVYDDIGHSKFLDDCAIFHGLETGYRIGKRYHAFMRYHWTNSVADIPDYAGRHEGDKKLRYGGVGIQIKLD